MSHNLKSETQRLRTPTALLPKGRRPTGRTERRVLVNGHWQRPDPPAATLLRWLRN